MSEGTKVVNYTDEMVANMVEIYSADPSTETVERIAAELEKSKRSVIAKLSTLGIYQPVAKTTKSGAPVVKKETLVEAINARFGGEFSSLVKANKADLQALVDALAAG